MVTKGSYLINKEVSKLETGGNTDLDATIVVLNVIMEEECLEYDNDEVDDRSDNRCYGLFLRVLRSVGELLWAAFIYLCYFY